MCCFLALMLNVDQTFCHDGNKLDCYVELGDFQSPAVASLIYAGDRQLYVFREGDSRVVTVHHF